MGLFSRKRKPRPVARQPVARQTAPRSPIVRVAFRDLTQPVPDNGPKGRYVYYWPFPQRPMPGQRVVVSSDFGPNSHAVVTGPGTAADANGVAIKTITRLVTDDEIAKAEKKADADARAWLRMGIRAAGFTVPGKSRQNVPAGYPPIPPADGDAPDAQTARDWARVWGKIQRLAEERDAPDEQVKKIKSIRYRWSAVARKLS